MRLDNLKSPKILVLLALGGTAAIAVVVAWLSFGRRNRNGRTGRQLENGEWLVSKDIIIEVLQNIKEQSITEVEELVLRLREERRQLHGHPEAYDACVRRLQQYTEKEDRESINASFK